MLAIMTIGAVSASENMTDDELTTQDLDSISETAHDDLILKESNSSNDTLTINQEDPISEYDSGPQGHVESADAQITYKNPIRYTIRLVGENVNNQEIFFSVYEVDSIGTKSTLDFFNVFTDSKGYATMSANLDWGRYYITVSAWDYGSAQNYLIVKPNGYRGLHITVDKNNHVINYGWAGILNGYFKLYKGGKLIKKIKVKSNEKDYKNYWSNYRNYNIKKLSKGKYTVKIVNAKGKVVAKKSFKISKKSSKNKKSKKKPAKKKTAKKKTKKKFKN